MYNLMMNGYAMRFSLIDNFITQLVLADDPNDTMTQRTIARIVGLNPDSLTDGEIEYIEQEAARRWNRRR